MKTPESLTTLMEYGIIEGVIRPLMSGKEAQVFLVMAGGVEAVAKVYKEAENRTFKHRADYTEGRKTRNSRDQRAMAKRSQHGKKKDEDAWRSTEVDMIYRLRDAGVTVPEPFNFVEGVLVMELVKDADGDPAPRLGDLSYTPAEAKAIYDQLMREVIRMLCAGVIHGDLSDFNVLMSATGPVVIDFPQSIDPTHNTNGQKLLLRDVENLHRFLARFAPDEPIRPYGQEIWALFQANKLDPKTELSGRYAAEEVKADTREVMELIEDAHRDERFRRGERPSDKEDEAFDGAVRSELTIAKPLRTVVDFTKDRAPRSGGRKRSSNRSRPAEKGRGEAAAGPRGPRRGPSGPAAESAETPAASTGNANDRSRENGRTNARGATRGDASSEARPKSGRRRRRGGKSTPEAERSVSASPSSHSSPPSGPRAQRDAEAPGRENGREANREARGEDDSARAARPRRRRRSGRGSRDGTNERATGAEVKSAGAPAGPRAARPRDDRSDRDGNKGASSPAGSDGEAPARPRRRRRRRTPASE